ncbi:hypothetical protein [Nocardia sp. NPDC003979]
MARNVSAPVTFCAERSRAGGDVLVNSAGMAIMKGVDIMAPAAFDTLFATNVGALFSGARRPAP